MRADVPGIDVNWRVEREVSPDMALRVHPFHARDVKSV
jgi:hypothetical protein